MNRPSNRMAADAAKHLSERFTEVLLRHADIMEAGGMSTQEAATAVMTAVEQLAFTAIGLVGLQAAPATRLAAIDRTIAKLTVNLCERATSMLTEIGKVEQMRGGHA